MLSMVDDWKASGLTQKAFSLLHGINIAILGYWVARSKEPAIISFIPITASLKKSS